MWYKRERKAFLPTHTHTQTHTYIHWTARPFLSRLTALHWPWREQWGPHICLPGPRQTWLLHPDPGDHTNHPQLMWNIRRSLSASITPPLFSEASPLAQCWVCWVLHIDHGYGSLAQLDKASQRYCVIVRFVLRDSESIHQPRPKCCSHVSAARRFLRGSELRERQTLLCYALGSEMASMCCSICTSAGLWPKACPVHFL